MLTYLERLHEIFDRPIVMEDVDPDEIVALVAEMAAIIEANKPLKAFRFADDEDTGVYGYVVIAHDETEAREMGNVPDDAEMFRKLSPHGMVLKTKDWRSIELTFVND